MAYKDIIIGAAEHGNTELVERLIKSGADVDLTDKEHRTPLMLAADNGHKETIELLLDHHANVNLVDRNGYGALWYAARHNYTKIMEVLLNAYGGDENCTILQLNHCWNFAFLRATIDSILVELLLTWGADVNFQQKSTGLTPLQMALKHLLIIGRNVDNCHKIIKTLLLHGADIRSKVDPYPSFSMRSIFHTVVISYNPLKYTKEIIFLYAAGATFPEVANARYTMYMPKIILDDQQHMLPLTALCRKRIRSYLLSPTGGNQNNLFTAVPHLPLPSSLKKFILFDIEI